MGKRWKPAKRIGCIILESKTLEWFEKHVSIVQSRHLGEESDSNSQVFFFNEMLHHQNLGGVSLSGLDADGDELK